MTIQCFDSLFIFLLIEGGSKLRKFFLVLKKAIKVGRLVVARYTSYVQTQMAVFK